MPKRGERAVPPVPPHGWTMRFLHKAAALGWRDLCAVAPGPTWDAWQALTFHPTESESRSRHHPLRLEYAVTSSTVCRWSSGSMR